MPRATSRLGRKIEGAVLLLASPAASYANSNTLAVDGGVSATYMALV